MAEVRDLRDYRSAHLAKVLAAEEREWQETLAWDFRKSSDLVRKFVDQGNLSGAVLLVAGVIQGYAYHVFEDGKALLGDLYVALEFRSAASEALLLNCVMDQMAALVDVPRVEAQIMMASAELGRPARFWREYEAFGRAYLSLQGAVEVKARALPAYIQLQLWTAQDQEAAAQLIPLTYYGHVDSRINDQYRNVAGARKFLNNIVQFPGCGVFNAAASVTAYDRRDGRFCGMVLSSVVAESSGHVTQLCVHPEYQRLGLGHELLRNAIELLRCRTVSLTVTTENRAARILYERFGFRVAKQFAAYVWANP
jgi:ribosomal protein S18 acetylase RimI-like enzyme